MQQGCFVAWTDNAPETSVMSLIIHPSPHRAPLNIQWGWDQVIIRSGEEKVERFWRMEYPFFFFSGVELIWCRYSPGYTSMQQHVQYNFDPDMNPSATPSDLKLHQSKCNLLANIIPRPHYPIGSDKWFSKWLLGDHRICPQKTENIIQVSCWL